MLPVSFSRPHLQFMNFLCSVFYNFVINMNDSKSENVSFVSGLISVLIVVLTEEGHSSNEMFSWVLIRTDDFFSRRHAPLTALFVLSRQCE